MHRQVKILRAHPHHPGRGQESYIVLTVVLSYLRGEPVEDVRLTSTEALELAKSLIQAALVVGGQRP